MIEKIKNELGNLQGNSQLRKFPQFRDDLIDLSSNSYLSLEKIPEINERALELCGGNLSGALASRLVMQNTPLFEELEETIRKWKKTNEILLFNSGFTANLGIIQALCDKNTAVFSDRLNHASIIDGIKLSGAKHFRFNHCDYAHLEELLRETSGDKFIISDSVFSMDGDVADIQKLIELAEANGAFLLIDEAHSTGVLRIIRSNYENLLIMGTLSKAVAGMGAYLQCSEIVKKYLINKCRPMIFSTALPRSVLAWNIAAVEYISKNEYLGTKLLKKAEDFRNELLKRGLSPFGNSQSQIVPIIVGSNENAVNLSNKFFESGLSAPAIRPPTVPVNTARCRISLNLGVSDEILEKITEIISKHFQK